MPRTSRRWPPAFVVLGATGLLTTAEISESSADSTSASAMIWASLAVASFLALLTIGAAAAVTAAGSRKWHVFCARRSTVCGLSLAALAGVFVVSLLWRGPLEHAFSHFDIGPSDIAGVGLLLAAGSCLVAAGAALIEAWDARRAERNWSESA